VLLTKYYYDDKIKQDEMGGIYSTRGKDEKLMQDFSADGKGSLGARECKLEDNINMDLKEIR
jgi:hypothetical protein